MKFNKEAERLLYKNLKLVIKELEKIKELSKFEKIEVSIDFREITTIDKLRYRMYKKATLNLENTKYYIKIYNAYGSYFDDTTIQIAEEGLLGKMIPSIDDNQKEEIVLFLEQYPEFRKNLIEKISRMTIEKRKTEIKDKKDEEKTLERLKAIEKRNTSDASIEIQLPPAMNQYELDIVEENGHKKGTLTISGLTIKIIASDDIRVINAPKAKGKGK